MLREGCVVCLHKRCWSTRVIKSDVPLCQFLVAFLHANAQAYICTYTAHETPSKNQEINNSTARRGKCKCGLRLPVFWFLHASRVSRWYWCNTRSISSPAGTRRIAAKNGVEQRCNSVKLVQWAPQGLPNSQGFWPGAQPGPAKETLTLYVRTSRRHEAKLSRAGLPEASR